MLKIGRKEGTFSGLVDDVFVREWLQFLDNFPPGLAPNKDSATWPRLANLSPDGCRTEALILW